MIPIQRAFRDPRYKGVVGITGTQMAKCLALDTPIPTPAGWRSMGDLRAGDFIFDERGYPTEVVEAHPVKVGSDCYRVTFDEGSEIICDADHLWRVERRFKLNGVQNVRIEVLSTVQMIECGWRNDGGALLSIPLAKSLQLEHADLPVDPYVLGMWLGDGHSYSQTIYYGAADQQTPANLAAAGATFTRIGPTEKPAVHRVCIEGLRKDLVRLGVFKNKHVPTAYLRSSESQRRALLAGLMDSDGTVCIQTRTSSFSSMLEPLARSVFELACSLSLRPRIQRKGDSWAVLFMAYSDQSIFRLDRKQARLNPRGARSALNGRRYIRSIVSVDSVPVRCVKVAASSGLFLAGSAMIPTHNTDTTANVFGQRLDDDPVPMMYVAPTRHFVEKQWEPRFTAMVDSSASLSPKMKRGRDESKTQKIVSGVAVSFVWAGSATSLAGAPVAVVIVDERDRMGPDVEGEGDPVELANARHETYPDGTTGVFSTPTTGAVKTIVDEETGLEHWGVSDEVQSPTWILWQQGTRHEWMWPCPDCKKHFSPRFKHLWWPEGSTAREITTENVALTCPACGVQIFETSKNWMNERGLPIAPGQSVKRGKVVGDGPVSDWYTQWTSGLCSPWRSWATTVRRFLRATAEHSSEKIQAVINTGCGELYSISGEAPPWEDVALLRLDYPMGTVPDGVRVILMSVDVQKDGLYYVVRGWSVKAHMESWLIEHGFIDGATNEPDVWEALGEFRQRLWGDNEKRISRCFVDQKYRTPYVFAFCRENRGWAFPAAGRMPQTQTPEAEKPLSTSSVDVTAGGRTVRGKEGGLMRWTLNTDFFKRWVHDRISKGALLAHKDENAKVVGGFHLSSDTTDEYCKQLVAEARIVKPSGRVMWMVVSRQNHYLDCEMMQIACAYSQRLQHFQQPKKVDEQTESDAPEPESVDSEPKRKPIPRRRPSGGWITQW